MTCCLEYLYNNCIRFNEECLKAKAIEDNNFLNNVFGPIVIGMVILLIILTIILIIDTIKERRN